MHYPKFEGSEVFPSHWRWDYTKICSQVQVVLCILHIIQKNCWCQNWRKMVLYNLQKSSKCGLGMTCSYLQLQTSLQSAQCSEIWVLDEFLFHLAHIWRPLLSWHNHVLSHPNSHYDSVLLLQYYYFPVIVTMIMNFCN